MNKKSSNKEKRNSHNEMNSKKNYSNQNDASKIKIYTKRNILIFFIPLFIFISIYLINNNPSLLELKERIKELESKIETIEKKIHKRKISIAFVYDYLYIYSVPRYLTVLSDLLVKTGKYDVYLINEKATDIDYPYNKKIKRIIQKDDIEAINTFEAENNIEIYILNNDISNNLDIYKSFGKKIVGIYHCVYLSNIYN